MVGDKTKKTKTISLILSVTLTRVIQYIFYIFSLQEHLLSLPGIEPRLPISIYVATLVLYRFLYQVPVN